VEYVRNKVGTHSDPIAVLNAIDEYGRTQKYLMNVGEDKGKIITNLIEENKPATIVELGGYCGYSAILFSSAQRATGVKHPKYYSLERSPKFAELIKNLIDFAGLEDVVEVRVGPSDESIYKMQAEGSLKHIDMLFLDHYKPAYITDLKLCEQLGLIDEGTLLVADNVIKPGNPPYLDYVRSTVAEKRKQLAGARRKDGAASKFETLTAFGRTASQYGGVEKLGTEGIGNPNLIYESRLIESWEPTGIPDGVEVTRCLGLDTS